MIKYIAFILLALPIVAQAQPQQTSPVVYNTNLPSQPAPSGAGYSREHPAPVPGIETGCAFFPRGSQEELNCEVGNYQSSGVLKWLGQWLEVNPKMTCMGFSATRTYIGDQMQVQINDGRSSYTLAYRKGKLLLPDSVPALILWLNRDAALRFLYSCRDAGYSMGELPPMTVRAKTVGEY